MPIIESVEGEMDALLNASKLLLVSARTAPKSGGVDDILTAIVFGNEKEALAKEMDKIARERSIKKFERDAQNLRDSQVVVLIGVRGTENLGMNCGACGYSDCNEFAKAPKKQGQDFTGPTCLFKAVDLGIALGSAVKTASNLNIDNRIMYRIGTAARRLNMLIEASIIMGIPMASRGKNVYFDRK